MAALVLADRSHEFTAKAVTAAKALAADVDVIAFEKAAAESAAKIAGVRKVFLAENEALKHALAEAATATLMPLMAGYDALVAAANSNAKDILPRLAAKLDVAPITDVIEILSADTFRRPIYAGNALETVQSADKIKIVSIRTTAFEAAKDGGNAPIETANAANANKSRFVSDQMTISARPELAAAKIIVSGGRALGSAEEFKAVLEPLADKLGAAIGASRAAVDSGYAPNDFQVGQTGKVVAPMLYIAIGISGAIQHLAGMKDSKIIVAINKDPEAPIFAIADYGWVTDYKTALPALMDALTQAGK